MLFQCSSLQTLELARLACIRSPLSSSFSCSGEFYADDLGVAGGDDDDADGEEGDVDERDAYIVDDDVALDVDDEDVDAGDTRDEDVRDDDEVCDDGGGLSLWRSSLQGWSGDCTLSTMHFLQAVP